MAFNGPAKSIHVFVALCDNKYQGIVPVPEKIGNGDDMNNNLYWGGIYGVRSFFSRSKEWKLVKQYGIDSVRLERLVYRHTSKNVYLVADAYRGRNIKECTIDLLNSCAVKLADTINVKGATIGINGNARLLAYIGHDGLMDFSLPDDFINKTKQKRDAIILACFSKKNFAFYLDGAKANNTLLTTGLMCPEAYTLHNALSAFVNNERDWASVQGNAAKAYAQYQHCSLKFANQLLVTGLK
ncbi:hypothetical protein IM792_00135 [Mucilaginibacter sp. JRF]|nr:hypothetical protein [Mucilaginibacter sp. JRF]